MKSTVREVLNSGREGKLALCVRPVASIVAIAALSCSGGAWAQTQNTVTNFYYDSVGNLLNSTNPVSIKREFRYDQLNRMVNSNHTTSTTTYFTKWTLDGIDQVTSVTDRRSLVTTYTMDGWGGRTAVSSPDTGSSTSAYDENGNLVSNTDARGKTTTYTYDALNRLTSMAFAGGAPVVFEYDGGPNGPASSIGKLSRVTYAVGETAYTYDGLGRLSTKADTITVPGAAQVVRRVAYTYVVDGPGTGKLASMTYPSGNRINYSYDSAGRVNSLTLNAATVSGGTDESAVTPLLSEITYTPTGKVQSWKWGAANAGKLYNRTYDLDDRVVSYPLGSASGLVRTLTYDAASRITNYTHAGTSTASSLNQSFGYDGFDRLTSSTAGGVTTTYSYDTNWNRTASTAPNASFTIATGSNRLVSTTLQPARSYGYDAMGNATSAGPWQYTYGDDSRLSQAQSGTMVVKYWYDGVGQRIAKQGAALRYYAYDEAGQTIGEYTAAGVVEETVYLDELPVIVFGQGVNYVFADHLGAPRVLEAEDGTVTWSWLDTDPYGAGGATTSNSVAEYNHRLPGQIRDAETGLHYNFYRDYDPKTGRYIESDPIGLDGGINTYSYAEANPISLADPHGLWAFGDPIDQRIVDATAGFGDVLSLGTSVLVRGLMGTNDQVNQCSVAYFSGAAAGVLVHIIGFKTGGELSLGKNLRIAPWGNRTGNKYGELPHYHSRGRPTPQGTTPPGQGIGRHRPWEQKSTDKNFGDRF